MSSPPSTLLPSHKSSKGKTPFAFSWSWIRARILQRCKASFVLSMLVALGMTALAIHRTIAMRLTTKPWAPAPIHFISRNCPAPNYETVATAARTTATTTTTATSSSNNKSPKICMTTLTDQQEADWLQKMLKWRQFDNLIEMTWPNKVQYCQKHGYHLFDSSRYLDNSRPPSWSKIVAARRLLIEEHCDWVVWLDADTVIMNSEKRVEDILPENADFVVTKQKTTSYNAGAWMIRNTDWSMQFLDTWWNMDEYVRIKGLSVSGDNDALFHYLTERMDQQEFNKHIVVPPRCSFNSVTKWVSPQKAIDYDQNPKLVEQEEWYMHEEYYHQGDLIAHVAGRNNKIDTTKELLEYAK